MCTGLSGADLLVASEAPVDLPARAQWLRQRGRDFGESLRLAVEEAFARGYRRVVVIGNDAPEISQDYVKTALDELSRGERKAVVGPATDGGYNLIGLTEPCFAAFETMPWGSAEVAQLTVERLRESGFEVAHLRKLEDIDSAQELVRFLNRISRHGPRARVALKRPSLGFDDFPHRNFGPSKRLITLTSASHPPPPTGCALRPCLPARCSNPCVRDPRKADREYIHGKAHRLAKTSHHRRWPDRNRGRARRARARIRRSRL